MPQKKAIRAKCLFCKQKPVKRAGSKYCSLACSNKSTAKPKPKPPKKIPLKDKLNSRQQKMVHGILEGKTHKQAHADAGYSPSDSGASQVMSNPKVQKAIQDHLNSRGITRDRLIDVLDRGLDAKRVISAIAGNEANGGTTDFIEVDDPSVQHKYLTTGLQLHRLLEKEDPQPPALNIEIIIESPTEKIREAHYVDEATGPVVDIEIEA